MKAENYSGGHRYVSFETGFWIADCGLQIADLRYSARCELLCRTVCFIKWIERACFAEKATEAVSDTTNPKSQI